MTPAKIIEMDSVIRGELTDDVPSGDKAESLDRKIRTVMRDFVVLGECLIEMRDGQYYRQLEHLYGPLPTFESYVKTVNGLNCRHAQRIIEATYVWKALVDNLGRPPGTPQKLPQTEKEVRALAHVAKINQEKREVEKADGSKTYVKQPVGVANGKAVAKHWERIVKEHEQKVADCEARGVKPPKFSSTFILHNLPNECQPPRIAKCRNNHPLLAMSNKLLDLINRLEAGGFVDSEKMKSKVMESDVAISAEEVSLVLTRIKNLRSSLDSVEKNVTEWIDYV